MQLIIVVETRTSCKSDYKYIKSAIDYYYKERQAQLTPIYAKCKSELIQQDKKLKHVKKNILVIQK